MRVSTCRIPGLLLIGLLMALFAQSGHADSASAIYKATGIRGGLVVHLGCGDGTLTTALRVSDKFLVQGLETDAVRVAALRRTLQKKGVYGPVTVMEFDGEKLPYVVNTVNLIVAEHLGRVPMSEVMRVLVPNGVAYIKQGGGWKKTVKPRPNDIDEWTHFLHGPGNNSVAEDEEIHSPRTLRWVAGPRWCRSHEFPSSVNGVVTTGGRIFTIFDEAPCGVFENLPQKCYLNARDAFNGKLLWKVPLRKWDSKYGTGKGNRWNIHHTIPRRLVALGDRVYCTLQFQESPVSVLDAATGRVITEYKGTTGADELILCDGVLVVKKTKSSPGATGLVRYETLRNELVGVDVASGKLLWEKTGTHIAPYTLAAADGRVVYHNLKELVCLDIRTGVQKWTTEHATGPIAGGKNILVVKDGVILHYGKQLGKAPPAPAQPARKGKKKKKKSRGGAQVLCAFSLADGKRMWQGKGGKPMSGGCTQPTEIHVIRGIVWSGMSASGLDLKTGKPVKELHLYKTISPGHHARCLRGKATINYLVDNKRGAEFIDVNGEDHMRNDWLRTPCFTGATLANGIFYKPPDQCLCYPGAKVFGYMGLASDPVKKLRPSTQLRKGPAFGKADGAVPTAADWPMYRLDDQRSGSTKAAVSTQLSKKWEVTLNATGTQPVIVGNRLWLAEKATNSVRCLDASSGKDIWQFTAGGPVDSTPTYYQGMVVFGSHDGCVYCLRAGDGALVWRFRAAPDSRQIVSYERVESLYPVQGSILVQDGIGYFAAGRSSFLDGGILCYAIDVRTGEVRGHHILDGPWPNIKEDVGRPFAMEGALPDLFVADTKKNLYMLRIKFDPTLKRIPVKRESPLGELAMGENHLTPTAGFLDDTGFDRVYWMYSKRWPGFYFSQYSPKSGQILVFDDSTTYAAKLYFRRQIWSPKFTPGGEQGCLLFADDNNNEPGFLEKGRKPLNWLPKGKVPDKHRTGGRGTDKGTGYVRYQPEKWQNLLDFRVRAMAKAGDKLILAGVPDVVPQNDPLAAFEGRAGGRLMIASAKDGKSIKAIDLPSPPVFDGVSVANGKIYMVTRDGKVACFGD